MPNVSRVPKTQHEQSRNNKCSPPDFGMIVKSEILRADLEVFVIVSKSSFYCLIE